MKDRFGREIEYMRISVTDRCNLRCQYCMPGGIEKVSHDEILTYEEIVRLCGAAAELGISRIRITGGEPLVRLGCAGLIKSIREIPGVEYVAMTTNGLLLAESASALAEAGLDAVNVSLDTLRPERFTKITGRDGLAGVIAGIEAALSRGMRVKINSVLMKGINDDEICDLAAVAEREPIDVRFIELMPLGAGKDFAAVPNGRALERIREKYHDVRVDNSMHGSGPAEYVRIEGFEGSIGFISPVSGCFCGGCNRIRVTSQGRIKPCLCHEDGVDIKGIFDSGDREREKEALKSAIIKAVDAKPETGCFDGRDAGHLRMSNIGG